MEKLLPGIALGAWSWRGWWRSGVSTKFTPQIASTSPEAMQEMLDGSKERLHTEIIDIYWIHNPMDVEKWTPDLIPLAKSGQIKTIGVSNHNLLHRCSERAGILDYCKKTGRGDSYNPHLKKLATLIREMEIVGMRFNASPAQIATAWGMKSVFPHFGNGKRRCRL